MDSSSESWNAENLLQKDLYMHIMFHTAGRFAASSVIINVFFIFNFVFIANAAVLFQDDFNDVIRSNKNWIPISASDSMIKLSDGHIELINTSPTFFSLAIHNISIVPPEFTFTGTVSSLSPGAGLYFGFNEKDDGYYGFGVFAGEKKIFLYRFDPDSTALLASRESPFIKPVENRLSISKKSGRILIFCNGYYLFSVDDSLVTDGDIGLMVQPLTRAAFEDIVMTDTGTDSLSFASFYDDFNNVYSFGWSFDGNASVQRGNGQLHIITSTNQRYCSGIAFPVQSFMMHAGVSFSGGDSSSFYGFYIKTGTDTNCRYLICALTADRNFTYCLLRSLMDSIPVRGMIAPEQRMYSNDSLVAIYDKNSYSFRVNNKILYSVENIKDVHESGIFVSKNLNVSFYGFQFKDIWTGTAAKRITFRLQNSNHRVNGFNCFTDFLGRNIKQNQDLFFANQILLEKHNTGTTKILKLENMLR